jgi:hypothetical protein
MLFIITITSPNHHLQSLSGRQYLNHRPFLLASSNSSTTNNSLRQLLKINSLTFTNNTVLDISKTLHRRMFLLPICCGFSSAPWEVTGFTSIKSEWVCSIS